jgi:hypothetical protein
VPLQVGGRPAVIAGDLVWVPPPHRLPWVALGLGVAGVAGLAAATRRWRTAALASATVGTVLFCVDSIGYWRAGNPTAAQLAWLVGWPLVAVGATVAMAIERRRAATAVGAATALVALVLAGVGGWDRLDVVTHSRIASTNPPALVRTSAVACLALGLTLLVRFLIDLLPRAIGSPPGPRPVGAPATEPPEQRTG